MTFVPLHNHSDYSLLDGASQLPQMVKLAKQLKIPALALTDHGVMYGAIELLKLCKSAQIKPIIGNEMYVINGSIHEPQKKKERRYHLVVLAKNATGYKNLVRLTTISHLQGIRGRGIFSRACIDKQLLKEHNEGLIVSTACLGGEIPQAILHGKIEKAIDIASWYQEVFGDDFYLEIQDHGSREDRIVNVEMVRIAKQLGINLVATNDSHYLTKDDIEAHDALLCILTGKVMSDEKRLRYTGTEYIKSEKEMCLLFRDHIEENIIVTAIENTARIAAKVGEYDLLKDYQMPLFPIPVNHTPFTYLSEISQQALSHRIGTLTRDGAEYFDRLNYELKVINEMGFPTYFLVVWDYIRFAREQGIPVGPGRGSAAGSLVAYVLGITNIDPVANGLLFERFLNPERKSMPDIDTDFCIERRNEVIDYVTARYGDNKVAQIITFNRMTSKAVLKDVARVLDIPYTEADRLAKLIPVIRGKPATLNLMISNDTPSPEFLRKYLSNPLIHHWVNMARRIEGTNKTFGVHAAGVVISAQPLDELVPLQLNNEGQIITQYFMEDIESMGLLKMDFLGLKNLTMIEKTIDLVIASCGEEIDIDRLPSGDIETFELLGRGDVEGVFQLESGGMKQIVRDLKPSCLDDISSILALYRPGPLDAGLIPKFINRKHGDEIINLAHSGLEPILADTYGIMVYQEQIMRIAQDLAGYTLGEADLLRRAMGKKKVSEMQRHRNVFVQKAGDKGIGESDAENLFDQMVLFAEYCFNKSHSAAYGAVTYQTAYLKAHYPAAYMAALLTVNSGASDKVQRYISNCNSMGIEVRPPDINGSDRNFTPRSGSILFGLSAIRNLGEGAIRQICESRIRHGLFTSLADLCDRLPITLLSRRNLECLINCGAMDSIAPNGNRAQLISDLDITIDWADSRAKDRAIGQGNLFDLPVSYNKNSSRGNLLTAPSGPAVEDYPATKKLRLEKEIVGFYLSHHPLKQLIQPVHLLAPIGLASLPEQEDKSKISAIVMVPEIKPIITKKGDMMAVLQIEDLTGSSEAVVFPKVYSQLSDYIILDARLLIWGSVDHRDEKVQIIIDDCRTIDELRILIIELTLSEAGDVSIQHKLRECLLLHQKQRSETGLTTPVVVSVKGNLGCQYVRLGYEFCVNDIQSALNTLHKQNFSAYLSPPVVNSRDKIETK
uniref:DNA polymerase III subunit alpha n=1 Tax=Paulinella micropora TaxID=1928728 RepID=A0A1L5YBF4_9EUKA|nr:DNA polymerase III subunit alpha [Paulinella micropora]AQX44790.1 DNA polymerase III subunit alpha [Paulinella micropora]